MKNTESGLTVLLKKKMDSETQGGAAGGAEYRELQLSLNNLMFNNYECKVATFRDVTEKKKLAKTEAANKLLHMLASSVTHEMVTPLKCMISFAATVQKELKNSPKREEADLIVTTAKLLLSQVKLMLDKNMIENDIFLPNLELAPLNKTVLDALNIQSQ